MRRHTGHETMPSIIHALQVPQRLPSSSGCEAPIAVVSAAAGGVSIIAGGAFASAELSCASALIGGGDTCGSGGQGVANIFGNDGIGASVPSGNLALGGGCFACCFATLSSTRAMSPSETDDCAGGAGGGISVCGEEARVLSALSTGWPQCGHEALRTIDRWQPGQALAAWSAFQSR